jgi:serine/threonine protein kinase
VHSREPGSILDGKYEIVQRLGTGGMGEVYLVRHVHLHELRVVKILRQDLATDPSAQKRFMREARLATQIKHPNVATLYDFATLPEGSFYMVWEHIQGQDVGDRIRSQGPFPVPVAVRLGVQALQGLEAVHNAGIIHRDLSPDNLMITEEKGGQPRIKIIDLGLARSLEPDDHHEITQVGMFMGKLRYCSPEQAGVTGVGGALDHRSDLYSFGLVLYEMIAGQAPFESDNPNGFIFKRLSEDPLSLRGRNPNVDVPMELDRVILRALEREPDRRFPDARAFIAALESVEKGLSAAETREIPVSVVAAAQAMQAPASAPVAPAVVPDVPPQRSVSELSRAERMDLLAQIDRAAKRVQESATDISRAEAALDAGRLDEARELVARIEAVNPRAQGLARLKERLTRIGDESRARRVAETEQVLTGYLQRKQLPLARLALDTLLEIQPDHPKRADYLGWIQHLEEEGEKVKRAEAAQAAGRAALERRDFAAARRELETIARYDPTGARAEAFSRELEEAEQGSKQGAEIARRRKRFEEHIAAERAVDAKTELDALSKLDVPRVTLDFYREQLAELRGRIQVEEKAGVLEQRYRQAVQDHDWFAARDIAQELGLAVPESRRAAEMFAEVDRLEAIHRRQQAVEQGVRQVETFIDQGDAAKAELALKILLQMDPENRNRKRLEKQVGSMRR